MKWLIFAAYLLTVPAANWTVSNVGTVCLPDGPCLIPVGFGMTAPSGVLWVGVALTLRDIVHVLPWALVYRGGRGPAALARGLGGGGA
jgi:hypothetical protein